MGSINKNESTKKRQRGDLMDWLQENTGTMATHTPCTPSPSFPGCHKVSNLAVPHAPCQDASPSTGPKALEPINRGLNPLKPWPQINLPSSLLSQVFCHSISYKTDKHIYILKYYTHCMSHSEVFVCPICHILRYYIYIICILKYFVFCMLCLRSGFPTKNFEEAHVNQEYQFFSHIFSRSFRKITIFQHRAGNTSLLM